MIFVLLLLLLFCFQEWVLVFESDKPECTLANILSGILYRFRVTGFSLDGEPTDPSDPSDPFVINLPGKKKV
jgi:hypothetical protein